MLDALRLTLPSGRRVTVRAEGEGPPVADDRAGGVRLFEGRVLRALELGRLVVEEEGESHPLGRADLDDWPLADYHALRDAAWRVGAIAQPDPEWRCRNCDEPLAVGPDDVAPKDLEHWYVEHEVPPLEGPFPLGASVAIGEHEADHIEMHAVTVREAVPLWRALTHEELRIAPRVVGALGVRALGEETDPVVIGRALEDAPDPAWASVETLFVLLNYAPRAHFPRVCGACGALHDLAAPADRELEVDPDAEALVLGEALPEPPPEASDFPDEDRFAEMVLRIGEEVYAERGVRHVELVVETGVAPVDGAGEPLLGSYQPIVEGDTAGYTDVRFRIEIYYRTFARMYEDAPYDVEAEVRETVDHEVQHHLHYLAGHDPMDEEERREAAAELERTFGTRAVRRAAIASVLGELKTLGWFVLAAVAVVAGIVLFLWARGEL